MSTVEKHPMELPHNSSLGNDSASPPISPTSKDFTLMPETTDVDRQRNKYGGKSVTIRRQSSTDWETPFGSDGHHFARVKNDEDHFEAKLDLNAFPGPQYKMNEIDVGVYAYDVLVHARKDNPNDPNRAISEVEREYRLPDDVDLETIKTKKNPLKREYSVEAEKIHGYGKNVALHVVDVMTHDPTIKYIQ